jgi:hypothetical protein
VVLGRGPDHGRTADVDHLDDLGTALSRGHGLFEGIQVDYDEVDGFDRRLGEVARVIVPRVVGEHASENLGVQGLDPPAEDLGESRLLLDERDRDAGLFQMRRGAARRNELDAALDEGAGEVGDAGFVVDGDEGPPYRRDRRRHRNGFGHGRR